MTKFVSSLIVCGALTTASLSATELNYEQDVAPSVPSVMFGHAPQKLDLISIAVYTVAGAATKKVHF